jgi:hypothetical protein
MDLMVRVSLPKHTHLLAMRKELKRRRRRKWNLNSSFSVPGTPDP